MSRQVLHVIAITEILTIPAKQKINASQTIDILYDDTRFKICERLPVTHTLQEVQGPSGRTTARMVFSS